MRQVPGRANTRTGLLALAVLSLITACVAADLRPEEIARLGHFTTQGASADMRGVVVAVPDADGAPVAAAAARLLHQSAGSGFVLAEGFARAHAIGVTFPAEGRATTYDGYTHTAQAGSVYREYVRMLRQAAGGALGLYIELRESAARGAPVQVATVDVTRDEAARIKQLRLRGTKVAVAPVDTLTYDPWATKHAGVLLLPPKGLSIQLPATSSLAAQDLAMWLGGVMALVGPVPPEATGRPAVLDRGRFSVLRRPSRVVIAAPHGSGDTLTDEMAGRIAEHLEASLIVVHGFMGTREQERRDRIAVDRPLEGPGIHSLERVTRDAQVVYNAYLERVRALTAWPPRLYVEIHCNGFPNTRGAIEIATVGVSSADALRIKTVYQSVATSALGRAPDVELRIEGVDPVYWNAYGNKLMGMLSLTPRALTIEFPFGEVVRDGVKRGAYADIIAEMLHVTLDTILAESSAEVAEMLQPPRRQMSRMRRPPP
jgi:hypothetical protein